MPDEAIYADRAVSLWRHGSVAVFRGSGAGYGLLYPLFAGAPLVFGSLATLKLLQAFVMSLAAVPVFFYGRRLMAPSYALLAAALTLASPLLLYSGLVMTEVLFYPVAALTLLAITRAVETAGVRDQAVALVMVVAAAATRTQAVVFVLVLAAAALLDSLLARDRARLRSFWPTWTVFGAFVFVALATPGVFGAYAGVVNGGYPIVLSFRLTYEHLAYLALSTAVLPFAALVVLLVEDRGRDRADTTAASRHCVRDPHRLRAGRILRRALCPAPPRPRSGVTASTPVSGLRTLARSRNATKALDRSPGLLRCARPARPHALGRPRGHRGAPRFVWFSAALPAQCTYRRGAARDARGGRGPDTLRVRSPPGGVRAARARAVIPRVHIRVGVLADRPKGARRSRGTARVST